MLVQTPDVLASFLMHSVLTAPLAIFLQLDTVRIVLLVFGGRIIATLALSARQSDHRTHEFSFYLFFKAHKIDYT